MTRQFEKCVHTAPRRRNLNPGHRLQQWDEGVAAKLEVGHHRRGDLMGVVQCGDARPLGENAGAGGVELDQLADLRRHVWGHHQPAQAPARHQKALGEAVHHHQPVVGRRNIQKTWGTAVCAGLVIKPLVDLVSQNPGASLAAMMEDLLLLLTRQSPAGGVVGCIDDEQLGLRSHR